MFLPESIAVVGAGYVGVVTAACFAELGHSVALHDLEEWKLDGLRNGKAPFFEPGLDALLARGVRSRRLSFHSRLPEALAEADIVFIAVGTPSGPDGSCDTGAVETTLLRASEHLRAGGILAIKSTVAVGTAERLSRVLAWGDNIQALPIVSNPEFLSEGSAIEDFMNPDRIVLGAGDHEAARRVARLYTSLDSPIVITDTSSAEMIKYVANAYLAMRVSFINEVAEMCEAMGADVLDVAHGAGLDHRIGRDFL
ncbi:MAG TPA: nucleotide sugar dehydrogenase, partial [Candidatus Sulfotelmatobacter sp.]|nr:nucleotide sugar dehydrogenase [Candidatus Sulfotelmatobacter sp.]